jgi:hypothetical protein
MYTCSIDMSLESGAVISSCQSLKPMLLANALITFKLYFSIHPVHGKRFWEMWRLLFKDAATSNRCQVDLRVTRELLL